MAEGTEELILRDGSHHRGGGGNLTAQFVWGDAKFGCPLAVEAEVTQGKVNLPQGGQTCIESAAAAQLVEFRLGQGFTGLPVARHAHQRGVIKAPVLHELAGEFHGIPFHVADAGCFRFLNGGEHVLETMAEFMEEGLHLFEAHQAWCVAHRWGLVADQIGHRQHH